MAIRRRGGTPEQARQYRAAGHAAALDFARLIGVEDSYRNDLKAKKDVVDPSGDTHSVKAGQKKWQIFLYRRSRFENDDGFQALDGIGALLIHCIDTFPPRFEDYRANELVSKERLRTPMRELKDRFQRKALLRAFLMKALFNGGEVNYLTVLDQDEYHIYHCQDVVQVLADALSVENSKAAKKGSPPEQKVVFKYEGRNVAELEMRNDSARHYGEVRFNMMKDRCLHLLRSHAPSPLTRYLRFDKSIVVYGDACRTFGNWQS